VTSKKIVYNPSKRVAGDQMGRQLRMLCVMRAAEDAELGEVRYELQQIFAMHAAPQVTAEEIDEAVADFFVPPHEGQARRLPKWLQSMDREMIQMVESKVFRCIKRPRDASGKLIPVIGHTFVFQKKTDANGNPVTPDPANNLFPEKARLAARGDKQKPGIHFDESKISAPVALEISNNLIDALAVRFDMILKGFDVVGAYLKVQFEDHEQLQVCMRIPTGYDHLFLPEGEVQGTGENEYVLLFLSYLYGLKQAGRAFWEDLDGVLVNKAGLIRSKVDKCVYYKLSGKPENPFDLLLSTHSDDGKCAVGDEAAYQHLKEVLLERYDKLKFTDHATQHLGVRQRQSVKEGFIFNDQQIYLEEVLLRTGMHDSKPVETPWEVKNFLLKEDCDGSGGDYPIYEVVGSLIYLYKTRFDIVPAVNHLSSFMQTPGTKVVQFAKRILRYLNGTRKRGILFSKDWSKGLLHQHRRLVAEPLEAMVYCDSDWAGDMETRRSRSGWLIILMGGVISGRSALQSTVAKSSVEAEYVASADVTAAFLHIRMFLEDLQVWHGSPQTMYLDNQGAIALAQSNDRNLPRRTRHIDIAHHFVRERCAGGEINFHWVPSAKEIADIMTKPIDRVKLVEFREYVAPECPPI
jgi:hypothetical protein